MIFIILVKLRDLFFLFYYGQLFSLLVQGRHFLKVTQGDGPNWISI